MTIHHSVVTDDHTPSGVLNAAAVHVARYGFHLPTHARDNYGPTRIEGHRPASDVGAIAFAIYGTEVPMPDPDGSPEFLRFRAAVNAYVDWLEDNDEYGEPTDSLGLATAFCKAANAWDTHHCGGVA